MRHLPSLLTITCNFVSLLTVSSAPKKKQKKTKSVNLCSAQLISAQLRRAHGQKINKKNRAQVSDGVAFQSHHAYMSNMFACPIKYNGTCFHSAEQLYQTEKARHAGDQLVESQLLECDSPYDAKRIGDAIRSSQSWDHIKLKVMRMIINLKFDQNPNIRDKLLKTKGNLYEATTDRFFGCGFSIAQHSRINSTSVTAQNHIGNLLREYRDNQQE